MKDKNKRRHSIILSSFLCGFLLFTGTMFKIKTDDGDGESEYFDAGKNKIRVTRIKENKQKEKVGRQYVTAALIVVIFISFGVLLYNMQVVNGSKYAAEGSASVSQSTVKATRGEILDRNGKVLVGNRQGSAVVFDATKFPSFSEQEERNKITHKSF